MRSDNDEERYCDTEGVGGRSYSYIARAISEEAGHAGTLATVESVDAHFPRVKRPLTLAPGVVQRQFLFHLLCIVNLRVFKASQ